MLMKSIIEEASSIIKAIEKAWLQAGKPQEFSIKIFQHAEKNFLGMTTKSAKIAILFETASEKSQETTEKKGFKQKSTSPKQKAFDEKQTQPTTEQKNSHREPKEPTPQAIPTAEKKSSKKIENFWSEPMLGEVTQWLKNTLDLIGKSDAQFNFDQKRYYLKVNFTKPLFEDSEKERTIFRSFSYLLIQVLRNKFKRNLRGFKVILSSETSS